MSKAAFLFLADGADPALHRTTVTTPSVVLDSIGVPSYDAAVEIVRQLVRDGYQAIELCGGFGHIGTARIAEVAGDIPVGVVRFDLHPDLNNQSGDKFF